MKNILFYLLVVALIPVYVLTLPYHIHKYRIFKEHEKKIRAHNVVLAAIVAKSQDPEAVFAAGTQQILNELQIYSLSRR